MLNTNFIQEAKHRPKFIVKFISRHNQLLPVPSFEEWEYGVLGVVDMLVEVSNSFPRMEVTTNIHLSGCKYNWVYKNIFKR